MLPYAKIDQALPLRDGKERLHAIMGSDPDGNFVWRSEKGDQAVQTVLEQNRRLIITRFHKSQIGGKTEYQHLDEQVIELTFRE